MKQRFLIHQPVAAWAAQTPDHPAVRFSKQQLSYQELFQQANQLARTLIAAGVRRGDRVGIYMNKNINSAVAIYGILTAGAAYVPLDPFAPVARINFVINDCGIRWLITQPGKVDSLKEILAETTVETLIGLPANTDLPAKCIDWSELAQVDASYPQEAEPTEQDLAYILYTSGSTGTPKGIMHTHRSGLSFAEWAADVYGLQQEDRLSNHAPLHFDLSTFDFFAGAVAGATTCIISEALTKLPASLSKWVAEERISVWYSVPFALMQLMEHGGLANKDLSALRWILFAGEPFPTKHLRDLMKMLPSVLFSNLYGPTETNVCTYYHVPQLAEDNDEPISIGKACANVEDLVVDLDGNPVAPGEIGELLIRGPIVMRGYWGRSELSNKGFFRRQIFGYCEDIFYRTGDLVQKMDDGNYKFLGRKDRQIKTRGYRVELDEIETALLAHSEVEEAAVYPVPDNQGSNLIEAAVILKPASTINDHDLIAHLAGRLPPYAVPAKISITSDFPRTSTGKINRRELQARAIELSIQ